MQIHSTPTGTLGASLATNMEKMMWWTKLTPSQRLALWASKASRHGKAEAWTSHPLENGDWVFVNTEVNAFEDSNMETHGSYVRRKRKAYDGLGPRRINYTVKTSGGRVLRWSSSRRAS